MTKWESRIEDRGSRIEAPARDDRDVPAVDPPSSILGPLPSPRISVILICKNEAETIRDCLDSVAWANEIVVVDSGSTDGTVDICREYTERVVVTDWPGYGPQKNRALELATGDWVLSIDADERVPPELFGEIWRAIHEPGGQVAFRVPRLSSYCGTWVRHSGWSPDFVTRLFRRDAGRFSDDLVHERLVVDGPVGTLREPLRHLTFRTLEDVLAKIDEYSTASARMHHARGRRGSLTQAVVHAAWAFLKAYVLRLGFLDGRTGFMLAVSNAEGTYYRYLKLMLLAEGLVAETLPTAVATRRGELGRALPTDELPFDVERGSRWAVPTLRSDAALGDDEVEAAIPMTVASLGEAK